MFLFKSSLKVKKTSSKKGWLKMLSLISKGLYFGYGQSIGTPGVFYGKEANTFMQKRGKKECNLRTFGSFMKKDCSRCSDHFLMLQL